MGKTKLKSALVVIIFAVLLTAMQVQSQEKLPEGFDINNKYLDETQDIGEQEKKMKEEWYQIEQEIKELELEQMDYENKWVNLKTKLREREIIYMSCVNRKFRSFWQIDKVEEERDKLEMQRSDMNKCRGNLEKTNASLESKRERIEYRRQDATRTNGYRYAFWEYRIGVNQLIEEYRVKYIIPFDNDLFYLYDLYIEGIQSYMDHYEVATKLCQNKTSMQLALEEAYIFLNKLAVATGKIQSRLSSPDVQCVQNQQ